MTPAAGLWGLVAGTIAAATTFILYKANAVSFGSDLAESMWGAGLAFVVDAVVTVLVTARTQPKPVEELRGLVYGMANVDESAAVSHRWWESPSLLGGFTLVGALILTIVFW
jgi:SSS family solute:Na+ symporter